MRLRIIAWILIILFAITLYLFSNESVTLALLIAVILALPVSFVVLRLTYKNLDVSLRESDSDEENKSFILRMKNNGFLPIASAEAEVKCTNLRTGEMDTYSISRSIGPFGTRKASFEVIPDHAGRYEISVTSASISDPLGIWQKDISCRDSKGMTVLPEVFDMQIIPADSAAMPENESYAGRSRGSVTGDMVGIREYIPGDPVRNIHWKLSEKLDKLLVKEMGTPVSDRLMVILDSSAEIAQNPVALDAVASVYTSLIHTLRLNEFEFSASWTDPSTGAAVVRKITSDDEARAAADEYLSVPAVLPSALHKIERDIADSRFAHVLIVGSTIPANIENITNGCKVTILMFGGAKNFSDRTVTVVGFEASTYKNDTAGIEV